VILVVGQEIAEAITPFVKWGAVVLGALGLIWLTIRYFEGRGAEKKELEVVAGGQKEERDARRSIKDRAAAMRARLRARSRRVQHNEGGELSSTSGAVPERDGPGEDR
jgi:hypothetical protein